MNLEELANDQRLGINNVKTISNGIQKAITDFCSYDHAVEFAEENNLTVVRLVNKGNDRYFLIDEIQNPEININDFFDSTYHKFTIDTIDNEFIKEAASAVERCDSVDKLIKKSRVISEIAFEYKYRMDNEGLLVVNSDWTNYKNYEEMNPSVFLPMDENEVYIIGCMEL